MSRIWIRRAMIAGALVLPGLAWAATEAASGGCGCGCFLGSLLGCPF